MNKNTRLDCPPKLDEGVKFANGVLAISSCASGIISMHMGKEKTKIIAYWTLLMYEFQVSFMEATNKQIYNAKI